VTLVVTAPVTPNFSLSASPASQSVVQGASTSYTVNDHAFPVDLLGVVTLSASGLPAGAAASFAPNPATSTSTMSVTTSSTTPTGSYPLTITGTSGTLVSYGFGDADSYRCGHPQFHTFPLHLPAER